MANITEYTTPTGAKRWRVRSDDGPSKAYDSEQAALEDLRRREADPGAALSAASEPPDMLSERRLKALAKRAGGNWSESLDAARALVWDMLKTPGLPMRRRIELLRVLSQLAASASRHIDDAEKEKELAELRSAVERVMGLREYDGDRSTHRK